MLKNLRYLLPVGLLIMLLTAPSAWAQEEETMDIDVEDTPSEGTPPPVDTAEGEAAGGVVTGEEATGEEATGEDATTDEEAAPKIDPVPGDIGPTIGGLSGGFRTVTTDIGLAHSFRIALYTQFFKSSDFLVAGDENTRFEGNLVVNYTPWEYIEIFLGAKSMANTNVRPNEPNRLDQELILALGDFSFGLKGKYDVLPYLGVGANMSLTFLNSVGGVSPDGDSTSFYIGAIGSLDLDPLANFPLRFHLNFGYQLDNSDNLAAFDASYSLASLQVEKFALGINHDRLQMKVAMDLPLRRWTGFGLTPIIEINTDFAVGLSDADFDTPRFTSGNPPVLSDEDIEGTVTAWMTIGARVNPIAGLLVNLAFDVGLASPGYGYGPPVMPWQFIFGLGYAVDTTDRIKVVEKEKVVEKTIEVAPKLGKARGRVLNGNTLEPIEGAVVTFPGRDLTGLYTDPDGTFLTYEMMPGKVNIMVRHEKYEAARLTVDLVALQTTNVDVKLVPAVPPVGTLTGKITTPKGKAVSATITLTGAEDREVSTLASGEFTVELKPGSYAAIVRAKGHFSKMAKLTVDGGGTSRLDVTMSKKPKRSLVQLTSHSITIKKKIHFATGTAEIKTDSSQILDSIVDVMLNYMKITKVEIAGHTDNRGKLNSNMQLSEARASAVRDYLIRNGVAASRLTAKGYGPTRPKRPNITKSNRAMNRRVEFVILEKQ